jgi:hypothetical protein
LGHETSSFTETRDFLIPTAVFAGLDFVVGVGTRGEPMVLAGAIMAIGLIITLDQNMVTSVMVLEISGVDSNRGQLVETLTEAVGMIGEITEVLEGDNYGRDIYKTSRKVLQSGVNAP